MSAYKQLLTAISFLRIRSPEMVWYQWIYPFIASIIVTSVYVIISVKPSLIGQNGIVSETYGFLGSLIGFYIAALAAVASFPSDSLDQIIRGRTPTLTSRRKGQKQTEELTRRRFLCILFGYCAFLSILTFIISLVSEALEPALLQSELLLQYSGLLIIVWLFVYSFLLSSLLITTLLGLHYLIDRMHRI